VTVAFQRRAFAGPGPPFPRCLTGAPAFSCGRPHHGPCRRTWPSPSARDTYDIYELLGHPHAHRLRTAVPAYPELFARGVSPRHRHRLRPRGTGLRAAIRLFRRAILGGSTGCSLAFSGPPTGTGWSNGPGFGGEGLLRMPGGGIAVSAPSMTGPVHRRGPTTRNSRSSRQRPITDALRHSGA